MKRVICYSGWMWAVVFVGMPFAGIAVAESPVAQDAPAHEAAPWCVERGPDGRAVAVPPGGTAVSGTDARLIAVPPGWRVEYGPDARAVAVPPGGTARAGVDGRLVAIPEGWSFEVSLDGRGVAVPPGGRVVSGRDERRIAVPEGWTYEVGLDGRAVAVPPGGTVVQGRDERLVAIPEGWSVGVGANDRMVAVPPGGDIFQGTDGLAIAVPPNDFDAEDLLTRMMIFDAQSKIRMWIVTVRVREGRGDTVDVSNTAYLSALGTELVRGQEYMMPPLTEMEYEGLQNELWFLEPGDSTKQGGAPIPVANPLRIVANIISSITDFISDPVPEQQDAGGRLFTWSAIETD